MESSHLLRCTRHLKGSRGGGVVGGRGMREKERPSSLALRSPVSSSSTSSTSRHDASCSRPPSVASYPSEATGELCVIPELHAHDLTATPDSRTPVDYPESNLDTHVRSGSRKPESTATPVSRTPERDAIAAETHTPDSNASRSRRTTPDISVAITLKPRPKHAVSKSVRRKVSQLRKNKGPRRAIYVATPVPPSRPVLPQQLRPAIPPQPRKLAPQPPAASLPQQPPKPLSQHPRKPAPQPPGVTLPQESNKTLPKRTPAPQPPVKSVPEESLPPLPQLSCTALPPQPREFNKIGRSQTEPPSSPDLLHVSWEWESARHTSLRRRPSRRISCRWKRLRAMPRRAPLRDMKVGGLGDESLEDNGDGDGDDTVVILPMRRQESEKFGWGSARRHMQGEDGGETGVVRRRAKSESAAASKSFKRKWRHSDLLFPRQLAEALQQAKSDESGEKSATLFQKAKHFPGYMRRVSHVLFKTSKEDEETECIVRRTGASTFYLDVDECPQEPPEAVLVDPFGGESSRSIRRRCPSVRGECMRPRTLNWNQKYKRAMEQRQASGPDICVTSPEGLFSPEGQEMDEDSKNEDGKGLLGRIFGQLRPRSGSVSTSKSGISSRSSMSGGSEDGGQSHSHSSDYEEQEEAERSGSASRIVGRMRGFGRDMQKKISRLKSPRGSTCSSPGPPEGLDQHRGSLTTPGTPSHPPATSCESLPSPVPQAPPPGSNRSSLSGENTEPYTGPFIGRARALVDCYPSPYDRDALKFKKGDTIDIIAKNLSGLWKGCVDGRVGHFKFILVEEEVERPARKSRSGRGKIPRRGRSRTLEELLNRLHLNHLIQVFTFNGYEDLDHFRELDKADLDCLGITDPETRGKLLTAAALLHDADSEPDDLPEKLETTEAALRRGDHGRDSGCYTDHRCSTQPQTASDENNLDTRQSTPTTDTSSGYHSRGNLNIPVEGQVTRDTLDSSSSEATSGTATLPSSSSDSYSFRAHPATVLPASPHTQPRHQDTTKLEQEVDYENKFEAARSVFEKEVVKREVPVSIRGQKQTAESKQAASETEKVGGSDAGGGGGGGTELPP